MTIRTTIASIALAACLAAGGPVLARESGDHTEVSKPLVQEMPPPQ